MAGRGKLLLFLCFLVVSLLVRLLFDESLRNCLASSQPSTLPSTPSSAPSSSPVPSSKQEEAHVAEISSEPILVPDQCNASSVSIKEHFDRVYTKNAWGKTDLTIQDFYNNGNWPPKMRHAVSGRGSELGPMTMTSLAMLNGAIRRFNVTSMIDIPCGDTNWIFDSLEIDTIPLYLGLDVAQKPLKMSETRLAHHKNKMFRLWDGAECPLPKYSTTHMTANQEQELHSFDLVHSRDVLQHLPLKTAVRFLCHVFTSGARVFVTTSFNKAKSNKEITPGDFYHNNLFLPPFGLPQAAEVVTCNMTHPTHEPDSTCVFDLSHGNWTETFVRDKCESMEQIN